MQLFPKKKLVSLMVAMGLILPYMAMAAENDYTVTGANPGSLPIVGAAGVSLPTITITDVGGDDFGQDPTTLRITLNSGNYPSVRWNRNITAGNLTIGGSCGYTTADSLAYNGAGLVADLQVSGGGSCANGESITVSGLEIATIYAATAPAANAILNVDNFTDSPGSAVATSSTISLAVTAADPNGSVTLANASVGATQNTTITLTPPFNTSTTSATDTLLDAGDHFSIIMPSHLDVSSISFVSHTFDGGTFSSCSTPFAQVVRCFVGTDITDADGVGTVVISGVVSLYEANTDITTLIAEDLDNGSAQVLSDSVVALTDSVAGTLTSTDVEPASLAKGVTGNVAVSFTNPGSVSIANNDKIVVTFPAGFDVSGANSGTCSSMDGTFVTSVAGQVVTLARQSNGTAQTAAAETCTISGIKNPTSAGSTGTYGLAVTRNTNENRYTATVAADIITSPTDNYTVAGGNPGALPDAGVSATLTSLTLTGVGADDFADNEVVQVVIDSVNYPNVVFDQTVAFGDLTVGGGCGYTAATALSYANATTANVTIDDTVGNDGCADTQTITLAGLKLTTLYAKTAPGANALVTVDNSTTSAGSAVATSNTVNLASSAGSLSATNVEPASLEQSTSGAATVSFTNTGLVSIPNDGKILVTFPAGFNVSGANGGTCSSMDGTFATGIAGQIVTITRQGDGTAQAAAAETCSISGIVNPAATGSTGTYAMQINDASNRVIYQDSAVSADTITAAPAPAPSTSTPVVGGGGGYGGVAVTPNSMRINTALQTETDTTTAESSRETSDEASHTTNTTPFMDVAGHWATKYINAMYDMGLISGQTATMLGPDHMPVQSAILSIISASFKKGAKTQKTDEKAPMTRAEALKLVLETSGINLYKKETEPSPFADVPKYAWFAFYVDVAYDYQIISGKDPMHFAPNDDITQAELSKIIVRTKELIK